MQSLTPTEILQKVHVRYENNIDYPGVGEEDFIVRVAYLDDSVSALEREAMNGVKFDFLRAEESLTAGGTGSDDLPTNFLSFLTDYIKVGSTEYVRTDKTTGNYDEQAGFAPYVFWKEGTKLRSLPALSGAVTYPYQRKFTRFPNGDEITTADGEGSYYIESILATLYLSDGDLNQYNVHANQAKDILESTKGEAITTAPNQSQFGIGM